MSNNLPINAKDFIGALARTTQRLGSNETGMSYLKLSKGGFFVYGVDDLETEDGSQWAVNPNSLAVGYVAWPINGTGKPLGEEMRGIADDPIIESRLPSVGDNAAWTQQVGMQLMCVSGEDKGVGVVFKASSKGGISGFSAFLNDVMTHLSGNPGDKIVPVIELEVNDYKHPTYGKIYTPVFTIKKWTTMDAMPQEDEPETAQEQEDEQEDEPAPKATRKAKAKAEPEAKPDDKPTRRRRRRAA